jgi:type I restriction-modification system DNA methylase subunit
MSDFVSEDAVKSAAVIIQAGLESFSAEIIPKTEIITSFANILGISLPESADEGHEKGNKITIAYVGGFFLLNALIFHERLAAFQKHILPISQLERDSIIDSLQKSWETILKEIGYYPVFHIAKELLLVLSKEVCSLQTLIETAKKVIEIQGALKYDLVGRFYHKLLANAKYLGTFYTSVPAATLLLKLTLSRKEFPINWLNLDDIGKLRIADLACGTGTLLVAAINTMC